MSGDSAGPVRAAGGVVWRRGPAGIEIVVIHRPAYDDWTLPKGKLDGDETWEAAALREVEEEASVRCILGPELASSTYVDRNGRDKLVRYWAMTVAAGTVGADNEVDVAEWLPLAEARRRMSYERDDPVLDSAAVLEQLASMTVQGLDHVVLTTTNVEISLAWWCGVLGLAGVRVDEWRRGEVPFPSVRVDDTTIIDLLVGKGPTVGLDHLCVVIAGARVDDLAVSGVFDVVAGPDDLFGAQGTGRSVYVRSPEGTTVELRTYP